MAIVCERAPRCNGCRQAEEYYRNWRTGSTNAVAFLRTRSLYQRDFAGAGASARPVIGDGVRAQEQCVAYFLPDSVEAVVFVSSAHRRMFKGGSHVGGRPGRLQVLVILVRRAGASSHCRWVDWLTFSTHVAAISARGSGARQIRTARSPARHAGRSEAPS